MPKIDRKMTKYRSKSLISGERVECQNRHTSGDSSVQNSDFIEIEERVDNIHLLFSSMEKENNLIYLVHKRGFLISFYPFTPANYDHKYQYVTKAK